MAESGKSIKKMLGSGQTVDTVRVGALADDIRAHAQRMLALFPDTPHSRSAPQTEALPSVWERRAEFETLATELEMAVSSLSDAARVGDTETIRERFRQLGKACLSCHKQFRKKKKRHASD